MPLNNFTRTLLQRFCHQMVSQSNLKIKAGVLQGDTLAPYLFAIAVDYIMREAVQGDEDKLGFELHPRRSSRQPAIKITDLLFADDIALLANEIWQAQELLSRVES